jgi:hypothetical protein
MCQKEKLKICEWLNGVDTGMDPRQAQRWTIQLELDTPKEMAEWDRKHGTVKETVDARDTERG